MRKQYKIKKRSCGLCKPHKKGWTNRWKIKDVNEMIESQKEIDYEKDDYRKEIEIEKKIADGVHTDIEA
jgi:hypothetical protein